MTLCSRYVVMAVTFSPESGMDNEAGPEDALRMSLNRWLESKVEPNIRYAQKLASSCAQGAGFGREEFLNGEPLAPFLAEAVRDAVAPAVVGACLGVLRGFWNVRSGNARSKNECAGKKRHLVGRALSQGLLGGAVGFGAGLAWKTQPLAANVALRSLQSTREARDERWLQRHPINYA
jgi:hypothetical protein